MIALDHLVFAVPELDHGVSFIEELLGIKVYPGGRHLHFGTHNALIRIGEESYLEIIAPDPTNPKDHPLWMGLTDVRSPGRLTRWGIKHPLDDMVMEGLKSYDPELSVISEGLREKPDGSFLKWMLTPPAPFPLVESCPFFIDWAGSDHPSNQLPPECLLKFLSVSSPRAQEINSFLDQIGIEFKIETSKEHRIIADIECPKGIITLT